MALLQRLALAAGRALSRAADWLLARGVEGQPTPAETPVAVTQEAGPEGGPPAHWLATVRARAPWLLARDRLVMRHAMHRRPPVVPVQPAQTASDGPRHTRHPTAPVIDTGATGVGKATARLESAIPSRPGHQKAAIPTSGPALGKPAPTPPVPAPLKRPSAPLIRSPEPARRQENAPAAQAMPTSSHSRAPSVVVAVPVDSAYSHQAPHPTDERLGTSSVRASAAWEGAAARSNAQPARFERESSPASIGKQQERARSEDGRLATSFLPVKWSRETPEHQRGTNSDSEWDDPANTGSWPALPEWGWQLWQTNPIQRLLQESVRQDRLRAEQAGSSWSERLS